LQVTALYNYSSINFKGMERGERKGRVREVEEGNMGRGFRYGRGREVVLETGEGYERKKGVEGKEKNEGLKIHR